MSRSGVARTLNFASGTLLAMTMAMLADRMAQAQIGQHCHPTNSPTLVAPATGASLVGTQVGFDWNQTNGVTDKYEIQVATASSFASQTLVWDLDRISTEVFLDMPSSGTYYWRVRGKCNLGFLGPWSVVNNYTLTFPDVTPPAATTDLRAVGVFHNGATLGWTAPGDDGNTGTVAQYIIKYSLSPIDASNFDQVSGTVVPPTPLPAGQWQVACIDGLSPRTTYWFALKSLDEANNASGISNVISLSPTTSGSSIICDNGSGARTSFDEMTPRLELSIGSLPNPSAGGVRLRYSTPSTFAGQSFDVGIYDVLGRRLRTVASGAASAGSFQQYWDRHTDDGSVAKPGIYFVRFRIGDQRLSRTIQLN